MRSISTPALRSLVQRGDDVRLEQRVHLGDDAALLSVPRVLRLVLDRAQHLLVQRERRQPQVLQLGRAPEPGQLDEDVAHVGADLLVAGEQAPVGVELGGARVVVAGGKVHVAPQPVVLAAHHQQHLGVGLVPDHAVDHVRADLFQPLRPVDVRFLVEAREQLQHHRHLLAAARRADQDFHQLGFRAGAVDGHLDRGHARIARRLLEERDDRLERLERVVEQDVAFAHHAQHVRIQHLGLALDLRRQSGPERRDT